jgi:hypothetical protein
MGREELTADAEGDRGVVERRHGRVLLSRTPRSRASVCQLRNLKTVQREAGTPYYFHGTNMPTSGWFQPCR